MNTCRKRELPNDGLQETGLLAVALYQVDLPAGPPFEQKSQDEPRKSATRAEVQQAEGRGRQRPELGAVENMPVPNIVQG